HSRHDESPKPEAEGEWSEGCRDNGNHSRREKDDSAGKPLEREHVGYGGDEGADCRSTLKHRLLRASEVGSHRSIVPVLVLIDWIGADFSEIVDVHVGKDGSAAECADGQN
ncbi:hypothetical protein PMAYCL1PPCAC_25798, partial [Pristionchus mayeri]